VRAVIAEIGFAGGSIAAFLSIAFLACAPPPPIDLDGPIAGWPEYGGTKGGMRYSPLTQISRENVTHLEPAWVYRSGDISDGSDGTTRTSFNATPILVEDTLYFCTPFNRVVAVDAETGSERWAFDPVLSLQRIEGPYTRACRGVAHLHDPADGPCRSRIYTATLDS
jgi:quinoprotein glucose dehydrogenase